jgi:hypothetical protein
MSRFDRRTIDRFIEQLGRRLEGFEPDVPPPSMPPEERPILWVIGTPRSGTTLMAETLAAAASVDWVDNLAARFPSQPEVGMLLSAAMRMHEPRPPAGGEFTIGRTSGMRGTHEFGFFWSRWLGLEDDASHRLSAAARDRVDIVGLRRRLHGMIAVADRPLLVRNVICGLNASLLARVHRRSVFVEVRRDPRDAAASILACRRTHAGGAHRWWSLRPSTWPPPRSAPDTGGGPNPVAAAEVARQVLDIHADLADEAAAMPDCAAWIRIPYERLCAEPAGVLADVAAAARRVAPGGGDIEIAAARLAPRSTRGTPSAHPEELEAIDAVLAGVRG